MDAAAKSDAATKNDASTKVDERNWLNLRGIDAAKFGLALYIVGMLTSGLYYARFHILALDFTRIQSIVVGVYLVGIYLAAPAACVWVVRHLSRFRLVRVSACLVLLAAIDVGLFKLLHPSPRAFKYGVSTTLVLQLILFVDWMAVWKSLLTRRLDFQLMHQPTRARLVAWSMVVCLHFSAMWFPRIPGSFAGGTPIYVQVFTATPGLADSRFLPVKDHPQLNNELDSYSLWLLFQTDTDVYLLDRLPSKGTLIDDDVLRIPRDQVIRMDYNTVPQ
jgi:hypothetical protein